MGGDVHDRDRIQTMKRLAPGVFIRQGKRKQFLTINGRKGKTVYGERLVRDGGKEYRIWDPAKSKLCASLCKGKTYLPDPSDVVLYLGASTGTTVSHISDILGKEGLLFAVEFAHRVARELVFLSQDRKNIAPIYGDASQPDTYAHRVCEADWLFQDIAQRHQVKIFLKNVDAFLKPGGYCLLAVKARSIDAVKKPQSVFNQVKHELTNSKLVKIVDQTILDPFQKDHILFICKKSKE